MSFNFTLLKTCGAARAGVFSTPHGDIPTPAFMPVGTQATVKTLSPAQLAGTGATMVLANTYHLHLHPGEDIVAQCGGLHQFMQWPGPLLTDSGGYQVFSLDQLRTLDDDGVTFRAPNGDPIRFTPEEATRIQNALGADVIMCFDECPPAKSSYEAVQTAIRRTTAWATRCQAYHQRSDQALFAIVQGGIYPDLREQSARELIALDFPGYAIGGVSVGEGADLIRQVVATTTPFLPVEKPRYLMGIGTYRELAQSVARGIDLFDCVLPTRLARHGAALVNGGERWNLKNAQFRRDYTPLDATCPCYTCQTFTRAYLCHLIRTQEVLGLTLLALHNVTELVRFVQSLRQAILDDRLLSAFPQYFEQMDS